MTNEELWAKLHEKMLNKLDKVMPVINDSSDLFIDLDWCDTTGEFNLEWIRHIIINIDDEQRMDYVIQIIASLYNRMLYNGENAAYYNDMPSFGIAKHKDIVGMMNSFKEQELKRRKANRDDDELKTIIRDKIRNQQSKKIDTSLSNYQKIEKENATLKQENAELINKMNTLKESSGGFTCGEYAVLLYAIVNKLEDKAVKTHLEKLFADITGYSHNCFHTKLMGAFSNKDKDYVYSKIKNEMPKLAEVVLKL